MCRELVVVFWLLFWSRNWPKRARLTGARVKWSSVKFSSILLSQTRLGPVEQEGCAALVVPLAQLTPQSAPEWPLAKIELATGRPAGDLRPSSCRPLVWPVRDYLPGPPLRRPRARARLQRPAGRPGGKCTPARPLRPAALYLNGHSSNYYVNQPSAHPKLASGGRGRTLFV